MEKVDRSDGGPNTVTVLTLAEGRRQGCSITSWTGVRKRVPAML